MKKKYKLIPLHNMRIWYIIMVDAEIIDGGVFQYGNIFQQYKRIQSLP